MASTLPELKTIEELNTELEIVFKYQVFKYQEYQDREMTHFLFREGFIAQSLWGDIRNPRSMLPDSEKARMVLEGVRDAVCRDSKMFHIFIDVLRECGRRYHSTVMKLTKKFTELGGNQLNPPDSVSKDPCPKSKFVTPSSYIWLLQQK